jgi:peptidoglycan L-alanyl-D-glutamate endopeptidase CwlK
VTNAKPWQSAHQYRRAIDGVPLRNGKPLWKYNSGDLEWQVVVEEAEKLGLEWAGRWKTFREFVHFQDLEGHTVQELYNLEGPG